MSRMLDHLKALCGLHGVSGYEDDVIAYMRDVMTPLADDITIDDTGNVIAIKQGKPGQPVLMFAAHMDEVGFMVRKVEDDVVRLMSAAGNFRVLPGSVVHIRTDDGAIVNAIAGIKSAHITESHEQSQSIDWKHLYLYVEESEHTVRVGNPVAYAPRFFHLPGNRVTSKALDNRAGCAAMLEAMERLYDADLDATVAFVGTVQEEISVEAAMAPAQRVGADVAIAVDGTLSYDAPETPAMGSVHLGGGPVITRMLRSPGLNAWTPNPKLALMLEQLAAEQAIPTQREAVYGLMSDIKPLRLLGISSGIIGIPMRGKHSSAEVMSLDDLEQSVDLMVAFAHAYNADTDLTRG